MMVVLWGPVRACVCQEHRSGGRVSETTFKFFIQLDSYTEFLTTSHICAHSRVVPGV